MWNCNLLFVGIFNLLTLMLLHEIMNELNQVEWILHNVNRVIQIATCFLIVVIITLMLLLKIGNEANWFAYGYVLVGKGFNASMQI